ncbi:AraC family transcriptional regulator [Nocardia paucivorans]|uniref:AraC family transcriptional regulator n=1 Tax=Nocardia paucivorans TaxID=114259 RepID=UPI0002DEC730|nr:AraC family transcriptional regulator [Nocardia paucivorans]
MTAQMNMPRSSTSAAILVQLGLTHGLTLAQCLDGSDITLAVLDDANGEIRAAQELRVVQNLVTHLGHVPGLGLSAGRRYHLATHGIWAFAVMTSRTVREAVRIGIEHMDIAYSFARWRLQETAGDGTLTLDYSLVPVELRQFLLERDLAELITLDRELFGAAVPPTTVELACPAPDYAELFTELLGAPPVFDAPITRLTLAREILELPMPQANPHVAAIARQQAADIMQRRRRRDGTAARVRACLLTRGVTAAQEEIAADLRMSVRTLRRRLEAEGTSYRDLVAETRHLLAEELLTLGTTVDEVARRLGYADASAFTHAFTRWTGTTPGRFARSTR